MSTTQSVGHFFDSLAPHYTEAIERCFPRYREMLWALIDSLPEDFRPRSILELGCGTGNLTTLLNARFPQARLHLIDLSADSLDVCQQRLHSQTQVTCDVGDFGQLAASDSQYDLIASSIAVHHLPAERKQWLLSQCFRWLSSQGRLCFADQFAGATSEATKKHIEHWRQISFAAGASEEEWESWMTHQAESDHHDSLPSHMQWLADAGFVEIDCPWRYLLWGVLVASKSVSPV